MNIQSILAVTDLSERGNRTVYRAAMIAAQHQALLKIMVAPEYFGAEVDTQTGSELARLAETICTRFGILVKRVAESSGRLSAVAEEARWVDLLVIGERRERSLRAMVCGQPIERLLRVVPCAVLVTRLNGSQRYRRVVVAVDFSPESKKMVRLAWSLDPDAEVELFHAVTPMHEGRLRYADVSEHAIKAYRQESVADARQQMFGLTDSSTARRNRVVSAIGRGDPARQAVVQQQHANAELLVVGKRRSSAVPDFFFGSVAQRVLRLSTADVLLVPHDLRLEPKVTPGLRSARSAA